MGFDHMSDGDSGRSKQGLKMKKERATEMKGEYEDFPIF
jgi:hypothetical protein